MCIRDRYRRILTGSPVTKSPLYLYKECEFLDPLLLGHSSYYTFRTRYAKMATANFGGRSVQIVVGYKNLEELSEKLKPFSFRILKEECLDYALKAPHDNGIWGGTTPRERFKIRRGQRTPDHYWSGAS